MSRFINLLFLLTSLAIFFSCTPKVSDSLSEDESVSNDTIEYNTGPCATFANARMGDDAVTAHVLYRDLFKMERYERAFPYWKKAYSIAPAADGKRNTHFADGITFYQYFYNQTEDEALKEKYVDTIFLLYDQMEECYGKDGYVSGRKGFDLYYTFQDLVSRDSIYSLFTESINMDGDSAYFFILNPFTDVLVKEYFDGNIEMEEAQDYAGKIMSRLEKGLSSGKNQAQWAIINNYVPARLSRFEGEKGFYDCNYYIDKYIPEFEENPTDCDVINKVYRNLIWGGCAQDDPNVIRLRQVRDENCAQPEAVAKSSKAREGFDALESGDFELAIQKFEEAAEETDDTDRKGQLYLVIAKIYYGSLKRFPEARTFALKAAEVKDNWGQPYLLIGKLYASSGPLCGPGTGWDSQVVVWPAMDQWQKARSIDPEAAEEATRLINQYHQYLPTYEDVFQRRLDRGDRFRVECWIQETTTIRTVD